MRKIAIFLLLGMLSGPVPNWAIEPLVLIPPTPTETPSISAGWFYSIQAFEGTGMSCFSCHSAGASRPFSRRILRQRSRMIESQVRLCIETPSRVHGRVPAEEDLESIVTTIKQIYQVQTP